MKIAVVGCGQIADAHIQEIKKISGIEVCAVCDSNIHMAEQAGVRFGIPKVYTRLEAMLREMQPHVVHITTPPGSHLHIGRTVVEHGAHAYVEKPFVLNAAEADEFIDNANRAGKLVCVGHNYAFDSTFLRLKKLYDEEQLGKIVHLDVVMSYAFDGPYGSIMMSDPTHWVHKLPGGLAQNNISHPLSLIIEFLRDENPDVYARGFRWRREKYGDDRDRFFDELRVLLVGKETTANMVFTCSSRPWQLSLIAYGSKSQAIASLGTRTVRVVKDGSLPGPFQRIQWARNHAKVARREYLRHLNNLLFGRLHGFEGMNELFRRFYLAIEGKGEMPVSMQVARRTTAIMDEIFKQCNEHDRV